VQPSFWEERWRLGQIGFHQLAVEEQLAKYWSELNVSAGNVLVPLCGKSLDLAWLRESGFQVTGIELSAVAVESLFWEQGILARRTAGAGIDRFDADRLRIFQGDLFTLDTARLGNFHAVYDRASLIALPPDERLRYVDALVSLTQPGTKTLLMTIEYSQQQTSGPPFSVSRSEVESLYGDRHSIRLLERRDILANEARLRARGVTELHENCFLLTRR
jgi:thiopurine S-methyltransferase